VVGASGFEPPTSWSRTRVLTFPLFSIDSYPLLQLVTYKKTVENSEASNSSVLGTILGTVPIGIQKAQAYATNTRRGGRSHLAHTRRPCETRNTLGGVLAEHMVSDLNPTGPKALGLPSVQELNLIGARRP
jgi:hypothetical protein